MSLVLSLLTLLTVAIAPAQAATTPTRAAVATTSAHAPAAAAVPTRAQPQRGCAADAVLRTAERCTGGQPDQVSEGGCGFLQRCVYFNRNEQLYLITGSKWIVQAALCAGSIGIGCVAAGVVVELAAQWLLGRGGICPTSSPRLRVQYFPFPTAEGCVA